MLYRIPYESTTDYASSKARIDSWHVSDMKQGKLRHRIPVFETNAASPEEAYKKMCEGVFPEDKRPIRGRTLIKLCACSDS